MKNNLFTYFLDRYIAASVSFVLAASVILRIYEIIAFVSNQTLPEGYLIYSGTGIINDILFNMFVCSLGIVPLYYLRRILARAFIGTVYLLSASYLLLTVMLIQYFAVTATVLDQAVFKYTGQEVLFTVKNSGELTFTNIIVAGALAAGIIAVSQKMRRFCIIKKKYLAAAFAILIPLQIVCISMLSNSISEQLHYNKTYYFARASTRYIAQKFTDNTVSDSALIQAIAVYQKTESKHNFTSGEYPLMHENRCENTLKPYFKQDLDSPNIVFVFVESLSSMLSGPEAKMGSFTPFIDSLCGKSLYWPNCLSSTERSFGIFASTLGSLPVGYEGMAFSNIGPPLPVHQSMLTVLKDNGYNTRFYYGAPGWFDGVGNFFQQQNTDYVLSHFGEKYNPFKSDDGHCVWWGYNDKELFSRSMEVQDSLSSASPRPFVSVYFTLTTHSPYHCPQQDKYEARFDNQLKCIAAGKAKAYSPETYKKQLSCFLYADESLRDFFAEFSKRKEFSNTIFVITGDHKSEFPMAENSIQCYRVPLIIYSPLLTQHKQFNATVSHLSIMPTLMALLRDNARIRLPETVECIGNSLQANDSCAYNGSQLFMRNNREIFEFIDGRHYICANSLFNILPSLELEENNDTALKRIMIMKMEAAKTTFKYACEQNRLLRNE